MATRRSGRAVFFIIIVLILVLVLAWAAWVVFLRPMLSPAPAIPTSTPPQASSAPLATEAPQVATVDIVMTTQLIPRGGVITENLVALVPIPASNYIEGTFFQKAEDVIGKRAKYDLQPHTPVNSALILDGVGSIASFDIPKGMVAISIPISKLSSVSYGLQTGDHVNVIASLLLIDVDPNFQTMLPNSSTSVTLPGKTSDQFTGTVIIGADVFGRAEYDSSLGAPVYVIPNQTDVDPNTGKPAQRPRLVSQTLVKDAIILHVGLFPQGVPSVATPAAAAPATEQQVPGQPTQAQTVPTPEVATVPDVVTLVVSPQDAVTINYLMLAGGSLNLVMRSAGDDTVNTTEAVTLQFVLDQYSIPNPAKLPYAIQPRRDNFINNVPPFPEAGTPAASLPIITPVPNSEVQPTPTPVK